MMNLITVKPASHLAVGDNLLFQDSSFACSAKVKEVSDEEGTGAVLVTAAQRNTYDPDLDLTLDPQALVLTIPDDPDDA